MVGHDSGKLGGHNQLWPDDKNIKVRLPLVQALMNLAAGLICPPRRRKEQA